MDRLDTFSLVGAGALGTHLATAMMKHGLLPQTIASRTTDSARTLCDALSAGTVRAADAIELAESDVLLLCVPDDAIRSVAGVLASTGADWNGRVVLHTSGARDACELDDLAGCGAETGSFHPIQTFVGTPDEALFRNVTIGVEGSPQAASVASHLAETLLAEPLVLSRDDKALYHAAAVMGGNFATVLLGAASDVWEHAVHGRTDFSRALGPLVKQSVANALSHGAGNSLTGPFARGDAETVRRQYVALKEHLPHLLPLYSALAVEAVHAAQRVGRLSTADAVVLLDMIHSHLPSHE